jgi:signal transduction histidine kinase
VLSVEALSLFSTALCLALFLAAVALTLASGVTSEPAWGSELGGAVWALSMVNFAIVGVLILRAQPSNSVGWTALAIGLAVQLGTFSGSYRDFVFLGDHRLPAASVIAWVAEWEWVLWVGAAGIYFLLLFPNGHVLTHRWRAIGWLGALGMTIAFIVTAFLPGRLTSAPYLRNPLGIEGARSTLEALAVGIVLIPFSIVGAGASLLVRFRKSSGELRLQLRWLATAGAVVALVYAVTLGATLLWSAMNQGGDDYPGWLRAVQDLANLVWVAIPIAAGIAILKHRLYDLDLVINKALVLALLAAFVASVYILVVAAIGNSIGLRGEPNLGLSIVATAVVAVAFQPARQRIERFARRVVFGERADPYDVLARFSDDVAGTYALDEVGPRMARVLAAATGAERAEVWVETSDGRTLAGIFPVGAAPKSEDTGKSRAFVAVTHGDETLGHLLLVKPPGEGVDRRQRRLLQDVAGQAGLVLKNVALFEELRAQFVQIQQQAEDIKRSRERIVSAQEEERRRIERDLHDGAQQRLVNLSLSLAVLERQVRSSGDQATANALGVTVAELNESLTELRELARGIHPAILREAGLAAALRSLAERSSIPTSVTDAIDGRLPEIVEATAYFVASEALVNAARHSRARAMQMNANVTDGHLTLTIVDDGVGEVDLQAGSGLRGLQDRVAALGGTLEISSNPSGTRLVARIPCE